MAIPHPTTIESLESKRFCQQCTYYTIYPTPGNCTHPSRPSFLSLVSGTIIIPQPEMGMEIYRADYCQGDNWKSRRIAEAIFYMNNPTTSKRGVI